MLFSVHELCTPIICLEKDMRKKYLFSKESLSLIHEDKLNDLSNSQSSLLSNPPSRKKFLESQGSLLRCSSLVLSSIMRKPDVCLCENKGADQLAVQVK